MLSYLVNRSKLSKAVFCPLLLNVFCLVWWNHQPCSQLCHKLRNHPQLWCSSSPTSSKVLLILSSKESGNSTLFISPQSLPWFTPSSPLILDFCKSVLTSFSDTIFVPLHQWTLGFIFISNLMMSPLAQNLTVFNWPQNTLHILRGAHRPFRSTVTSSLSPA